MMWLVWRQHRVQVLATIGLLLALGAFLLAMGREAATVVSYLPIVPLLVGVFWGAPVLSRELERGTHRLAWTQSVTRRHWLAAKLGGLGLVVTLAGLALGLMINAWAKASDSDVFADEVLFGGTGIAVGAWWLFAFVLGVSTGGLTRRLLPAIGVTIAVFVVALYGMFQARDEYAEPLRGVPDGPGALVTGSALVSPSGVEVEEAPECADAGRRFYLECVDEAGYSTILYYQPADRYWRFQWTETGILLLGAVLLAVPVVYRVLRRPV